MGHASPDRSATSCQSHCRQRPSSESPRDPVDREPLARPLGGRASRPVVPLLAPNSQARPRDRFTPLHEAYAYFAGTLGLSSRRQGFEFRWGHHFFPPRETAEARAAGRVRIAPNPEGESHPSANVTALALRVPSRQVRHGAGRSRGRDRSWTRIRTRADYTMVPAGRDDAPTTSRRDGRRLRVCRRSPSRLSAGSLSGCAADLVPVRPVSPRLVG